MATFLQQKPDEFTPYTPKLDLQAYMTVAMQRQQAYDQNITIAQQAADYVMGKGQAMPTPIDDNSKSKEGTDNTEIAGFSGTQGGGIRLMREADNKVLQKLQKDLQSNIKKMGQADFSSQKVLNQSLGLIRQVTDNRQIQNGIISTRNIELQNLDRERYKKDGKTSVQNDDYMKEQMDAYLNSSSPTAVYGNTEYVPYQNITENFNQYIKDFVDPLGTSGQEFVATGSPEAGFEAYGINERGDKKLLSRERITSIWNSYVATNPDVARQLEIDANYFAKTTPDEVAFEMHTASLKQTIQLGMQQKEHLEMLMTTTTDSAELEVYRNELFDLEAMTGAYIEQGKRELQAFQDNPQQSKANIYKGTMSKLVVDTNYKSDAFSSFKANPIGNEIRRAREKSIDQNLSEREFGLKVRLQDFKEETEMWNRQQKEIESAVARGVVNGVNGNIVPLGVDSEEFNSSAYSRVSTMLDGIGQQIERLTDEELYAMMITDTQGNGVSLANELFEERENIYDADGNLVSPKGIYRKKGATNKIDAYRNQLVQSVETGSNQDENAVKFVKNFQEREAEFRGLQERVSQADSKASSLLNSPEYISKIGRPTDVVQSEKREGGGTIDITVRDLESVYQLVFSNKSWKVGEDFERQAERMVGAEKWGIIKKNMPQTFWEELKSGLNPVNLFKNAWRTSSEINRSLENMNNLAIKQGDGYKARNNSLRDINEMHRDVAYVIPFNDKANSTKLSYIQEFINSDDFSKKGRGDFGNWQTILSNASKGDASISAANATQISIIKRSDGKYYLNASGGNTSVKSILISEERASLLAPDLFEQNPFSGELKALRYNESNSGTSILVKPTQGSSSPAGIIRGGRGQGRQIPVKYNVKSRTVEGQQRFLPEVHYYSKENKRWYQLPFGQNNSGEWFTDYAQLKNYVDNIDDNAINYIRTQKR